MVGSQSFTTDETGRFIAQVPADDDASLASGLKAMRVDTINDAERETLPGTGAEIADAAAANSGLISIAVSSRIRLAPLCLARSVDTGAEVLWFRYTNRYGETLDVEDSRLNQISSPSGLPYPISRFDSTEMDKPDGWLGFEWPLDYFRDILPGTDTEVIRATWRLIGGEVALDAPKADIPLCTDSLIDRGCSRLSTALTNRLFQTALMTVRTLSNAATQAKKQGIWKPRGNLRKPLYARAADSLRAMRRILNGLPREMFLCTNGAPQGCREVTYPKAELLTRYQEIFKVKLPPQLKRLAKMYPAERRKFMAELNRQPDRFVACGP